LFQKIGKKQKADEEMFADAPEEFLDEIMGTLMKDPVASVQQQINKMNCELMLTYDTPALRQTGSRNLTGQKTLPMIWGTYMKLVTKYQISAINSC
jgi:hypothetical protein